MTSALAWIALFGALVTLFFAVLIPAFQFSGRGDIPSDLPVYPGAHLESAYRAATGGCSSVDAVWSTADGPDAVMAFYQQRLMGDWTVTATNAGTIDFESTVGLRRTGTIYVRSNALGGQTVIELLLWTTAPGSNVRCVSGTPG